MRLTMAQSYITGAELGDKRVLILHGVPIRPSSAVLRRGCSAAIPAPATLETSALTTRNAEICSAIGPAAAELGLHFVGIDLVGGYLRRST